VYLDLCCLKRPFDSQDHPIVRLETEAINSLLGASADRVLLIRTASHAVENAFNNLRARQEAISYWLAQAPLEVVPVARLGSRVEELMALGFGRFDGVHIGSAELTQAEVFVTVDYSLLKRARTHAAVLQVRVSDPVRVAEEVFGGTAHH
jgi:hypothetical protein